LTVGWLIDQSISIDMTFSLRPDTSSHFLLDNPECVWIKVEMCENETSGLALVIVRLIVIVLLIG
jgi:hypothetical protein